MVKEIVKIKRNNTLQTATTPSALSQNLIQEVLVVSTATNGNERKIKVEKKEYHFAKDIILKDGVLLPSPDYKKFPKGKCRETLYADGYVASVIEIHSTWSQEDAIYVLGSIFKEKLKDFADPR